MPMDRSKYPPEWEEISNRIRFRRALGRCECVGECGRHENRCDAVHGARHPVTGSYVTLTTAHLGIDKPDGMPGDKSDTMDCRDENLKAMCQYCHLNFDSADHAASAAETRRQALIYAGQMEMFTR